MGNKLKPNLGHNQYCLNLDGDWQRRGSNNRPPLSVLFFVMKPPQSTASEVHELALHHCEKHQTGRRPHPAHLLHISVLPVWAASKPPALIIDKATAAAETLLVPPIDFVFDHTQLLGNKKHIGLVERSANYSFNQFAEMLQQALGRKGLPRFPFEPSTPHMTLIYDRKGTPIITLERPVIWTASEFILVFSWRGQRRHEEFGRWSFSLEAPAYPKRPEQLHLNLGGEDTYAV